VPKVVKKSKYVITVSNFERNTILERLNLPEEKVKVVYNAVNERFKDNFSPEQKNNFRKKYALPENFILFLGNTAPKKNTPHVVQAFAAYCDQVSEAIPLVILDYDPNLVREMLVNLGKEPYFNKILFPGYVAPSEMPLMYSVSTLFLYPSLRESFGLPILEAMGCGTPVISSNTSSMPEVAGDAALLIDPYKPEEISQALIQVLGDGQLRMDLKMKGIERASLFTWKASAESLLSIYKLMLQ
jgi:glycosyltransferase involved in cell wall biosynthesis